MIPGTLIKLGERQYLLPPLNAEAMEMHAEFLKQVIGKGIEQDRLVECLPAIADLVHCALRRNYPEIDIAEVKRNVDFGNLNGLITDLFKTSGFTESTGEATPGNGPTGAR